MPDRLDVLRVPAGICLVAMLCFVVSCAYLHRPTEQVSGVLSRIAWERCYAVPGLGLIDCGGLTLLQLSPDSASAAEVRNAVRDASSLDAARSSVRRDYFFIPSYVGLLVFLGVLVVRLAELVDRRWIIRVMFAVIPLQLVAGALDGAENVGLMTMLYLGGDHIPSAVARWTFRFAVGKWVLVIAGVIVTGGLLVYTTVRVWRNRHRLRAASA
jgi:hypothetical protein